MTSFGFANFKHLTERHDHTKGYVVNETMVVEVEITLHEVFPPVKLVIQISRLDSYFSGLSEYFNATRTPHLGEGSKPDTQHSELASDTPSPSADDIEKAKHTLKECPSDLFKLNMTEAFFCPVHLKPCPSWVISG
ncbi:hypothetical protein CDL15_Pgr015864 [Punica granatum]|uniref:MATH domain-containing protein n=1 Tax=Punica granatum TaxID=22663 RepID=A0A218XPW0_PUNGR|nr:hypothetical protein CDL15_Pgr015864 [Punica granatum]PKI37150.1 hypothetical protein CRG98_042485 [Punica granatum]